MWRKGEKISENYSSGQSEPLSKRLSGLLYESLDLEVTNSIPGRGKTFRVDYFILGTVWSSLFCHIFSFHSSIYEMSPFQLKLTPVKKTIKNDTCVKFFPSF